VRTRFTFLSRFAAKFIEVAGAGLASALCAYFLGQIERPPPPPATVVQMSPVNAERTRMARDDHPRLGESARTETEGQPERRGGHPGNRLSAEACETGTGRTTAPQSAVGAGPARGSEGALGRAAGDLAIPRRIQFCA
jgi:hypothetical protein